MVYINNFICYTEVIDLCSADGTSKGLFKDLEGNAKKFFGNREFCHIVLVIRSKK